ncbi:MAG: hypothetical protein K8I60_07275 [Anaerolineae bacterium]|nr:hypothetical protein [Anaerolineae bacterium]
MDEQRLEQILIKLANTHAPVTIQDWPTLRGTPNGLSILARRLADFNILILAGDIAPSFRAITESSTALLQDWVGIYGQFYSLLADSLFPHYAQQGQNIRGHYTDSLWSPVVVYLRGTIPPLIKVMAGIVTPYVTARQTQTVISNMELVGVMEVVLEELEAQDIPLTLHKQLIEQGTNLLSRLLSNPIRQYPLIIPDRDLFQDSRPMPPVNATAQTPQAPPQPEQPKPATTEPPAKPPHLPGLPQSASRAQPLPQLNTADDDSQTARADSWTDSPKSTRVDDTDQLSATHPILPGIEDVLNHTPPEPASPVEAEEEEDDESKPQRLGPSMPLFYKNRDEKPNEKRRRGPRLPRPRPDDEK